MTTYSTTYAGIIVTILGWLGIGHLVTNAEVSTIIDNIVQIVGLGIAIYGRYKAGGVTKLGFRKRN